MHTFEISTEDLQKLKELLYVLDNFDEEDENGEIEPWDFQDSIDHADISREIISIIIPLVNKI